MMRIGLVSDSHGSPASVRRALHALGYVHLLVHLGDGAGDADGCEPRLIQIKGNCDILSSLPREKIEMLEGNTAALFCHGDAWNVKWGLDRLSYHAQQVGVQVACFGHTHQSLVDHDGHVLLVNPGSCRGYDATCALLEVDRGVIRPKIIRLNDA